MVRWRLLTVAATTCVTFRCRHIYHHEFTGMLVMVLRLAPSPSGYRDVVSFVTA